MIPLDYDVARMLLAHNIIVEPTKKEMYWIGTTHETRLFSFNFCSLKVKYDASKQKTFVVISKSNKEFPYNFAEKINEKFGNDYFEYAPSFDYSDNNSKNKKNSDSNPVLSRIYIYTMEQLEFVLYLLGRPKAQVYKSKHLNNHIR